MDQGIRVDARWRVVYIGAVAAAAFFLRSFAGAALLVVGQAILWFVVGLPWRHLLRRILKLAGFMVFVLVSYALVSDDPATDRFIPMGIGSMQIPINVEGLRTGVMMIARMLAVILASQVARAGDPRAIAQGLRGLGTPLLIAVPVDAVLALLGGDGGHGGGGGGGGGRGMGRGGGGRGGGGGGGGGRGMGRGGGGGGGMGRGGGGGASPRSDQDSQAPDEPTGVLASLKRLLKGDMAPLIGGLERHIDRAEHHAQMTEGARLSAAHVRTISVVAGVSLTMLGIKALKILPSIPFAPGHKLVLLTPLYIVATILAPSRLGATLTGITMGTVAFLLGDGKYGVFEILKHISPGIVSDLFVPVLIRGGASPGALAWCTLGGTMGAARFSTIVGITALVQAPTVAYAILLPGLAVHTTFGFLSGYATYKVVQSTRQLRDAWNRRNDLPSDHRSPSTSAENTTNSSTKSRETSS